MADWINNMKKELQGLEKKSWGGYTPRITKSNLRKVPNWKLPGYDGIHGFWFYKVTSIYDRLALQLSGCVEEANIPEWMTKTTLTLKDPQKEPSPATIFAENTVRTEERIDQLLFYML